MMTLRRPPRRGFGEQPATLAAIQNLFARGELGGYWPADPQYAYEDSSGTTLASVNGVVGIRYDNSQGLNPGANIVTNSGDPFIATTNWSARANCTLSVVNGNLRMTYSNTSAARMSHQLTTVTGATYKVSCVIASVSGQSFKAYVYGSVFSTPITFTANISVPGTYTIIFTATETTSNIDIGTVASTADNYSEISSIYINKIPGNHSVQTTTANKPYLRRTPNSNVPWYDSNTSTGALTATFPSSLGSSCTIASVTPEGVSILENQTVGSTYNICPPYGYNSDVLIINRALTVAEKALVTRVMQRSVPTLGSNLVVNGAFATDTDWTKGTGWSIDAGVATKSAGTASNLTETLGVSGNQYRVTADITRTAGTVGAYNGTAQIGATEVTTASEKYAMKTTSTTIGFRGDASFAGTVDNAVIQEIL